MNSKSFHCAMILSGCGFLDGAEIHESVMTMLAVARAGGIYQAFAPDINQHDVVNHLTRQSVKEKRNVLIESARIARGKIKSLKEFRADNFDALLLPGGYGAAKNLSSFAFDGAACTVQEDVKKAVMAMHQSGKPIGALCIAPVILAKLLKDVLVTVGQDAEANAALSMMGARTQNTGHKEVIVDPKNKIVTTPCYMLDATIDQIADGAANLVDAVYQLISEKVGRSSGNPVIGD